MKPARRIKDLQLLSAVGFTGKVVGGLHLQKDRGLVYPVGVGLGVWDRVGGRHALLHAHNRPVTALSISRSGRLIVSAQNSDPGCQARVVVWTYDNRQEYGSYTVHREEVAAVGVTAGEEYVVSLGGILDGYLVIWHIPSKRPLTSVVAGEPGLGIATLLCTAPRTPTLMLVGGVRMLRAWSLNPDNNRLTPTPISLGLLERNYTCLQIDECEELVYASTTTGDVVKVKLSITPGQAVGVAVLVSVMAPRPTPTPGAPTLIRAPTPGIQTLLVLPGGDLLVGDMGGTLRAYRQIPDLREDGRPVCSGPPRAHGTVKYTHPKDPTRPLLAQVWCVEVGSEVTSVSMVGREVVVGTIKSEMFMLQLPLPTTTVPNQRPRNLGSNPRSSRATTTSSLPSNLSANNTQTNKLTPSKLNTQKKNNGASIKSNNELQSSKQPFRNTNKIHSQASRGDQELTVFDSTPPEVHLLSTCHSEPVYDVTFPRGVGELVVSAGVGGVRVWNVRSLQEVLRVELPGLVCCCCSVTPTLHTIITGWSDGRLRGLGAESGRVVWVVEDAHHGGVNTVVALTNDHVVSGGRDGRVRVWLPEGCGMRMTASQKEHRGEVTHLALAPSEARVLSCSGDGSCILWLLPELERMYRLTAHTVFLGGSLLKSGEIVTVGSDGSLLVWDHLDGTLLADLPASNTPITTIAATPDDATIVTAGEDAVIKVWNWNKGRVTHEGQGHSGAVTKICISPSGDVLASVGKDGALLFWKIPPKKTAATNTS